ncbi:MAG: hypothetical protein AUJ92_02395 [Armatimonadetes bacterium CG2_30_59_28]|nr:DUF4838 domain-containing protein [Armatimonadota bacterium]OIO98023.1 MAG: hypothetical protein AUJ92_02395 [Armatimonadetes bacterium CG2_30_59_28]
MFIRRIILVAAAFVFPISHALALDIVKGGKSAYTIVTPDNPLPAAKSAADELQAYLRRITGVEVLLVPESKSPDSHRIFVGSCKATESAGINAPEPERFVVQVQGNDVFIVGGDTDGPFLYAATRTGTFYGVTQLLYRFGGVRWLWPGELGTVVPTSKNLTIPDNLNWSDGPDFKIRNQWLVYRNPPAIYEAYQSWWRHVGQGQSISGNSGHAYTRLIEGNKYFDEHPEYYALVNGARRQLYGDHLSAGQICTSNPDVIRIAAENAMKGAADIVSLSPNDGAGFCECDNCRALDVQESLIDWDGKQIPALTDRIFTFVNAVADLVNKEKPDQQFGHYCYTFFKKPPARLQRLNPNVVLFFTQGCHWYRDPELKKQYREYIDAWSKYGNPMVCREYYGLIYWHHTPNIHTRLIEEDIKFFGARGAIGVNSETCYDFSTHGPNYYLAARLMWDTQQTREQILEDYYTAAFGPAAKDVEKYFDIFERRLASLGAEASGGSSANIQKLDLQFDRATISQARARLETAYTRTKDPVIHQRLDFIRIGLDYTDVTTRLIALGKKLNAAGMSLYPLEAARLEKMPSPQEFISMLREAQQLNDRRWELIRSQGDLPALHVAALEDSENRRRWTEQINSRYEVLSDEAGRYLSLPLEWKFRLEKTGDGEPKGWHVTDLNDRDWATIQTNMAWEKQGYADYDGIAWYRLRFDVPEDKAKSERVTIRFGAVDESCWFWLNGEKIGEFIFDVEKDADSWHKPLDFDIAGKLKAGENVIALRVRDSMGVGGLWKPSYLVFGQEQPNLLKNGSFEEPVGAEWNLGSAGEVKHEVLENGGYESARCIRFTVPENEQALWQMSTTVEAGEGHRYGFSFHYRTEGLRPHPTIKVSPTVRVIFAGEDGKSITPTSGYLWMPVNLPDNAPDWQEASVFYKTLPMTKKVRITVFFHRPGTYWIDDVTLRELK